MLFTIAAVLGGAPPVSAAPLTTPMASLSYFIGAWACAGVFPSSGKTIASTMRYESDLRGDALLKHHADAPPNSYLALEAWGYDSHAKRFNAVVLDNFGIQVLSVGNHVRASALRAGIRRSSCGRQNRRFSQLSALSTRA